MFLLCIATENCCLETLKGSFYSAINLGLVEAKNAFSHFLKQMVDFLGVGHITLYIIMLTHTTIYVYLLQSLSPEPVVSYYRPACLVNHGFYAIGEDVRPGRPVLDPASFSLVVPP